MTFGTEVVITAMVVSVAGLLAAIGLPMTSWAEHRGEHWLIRAGRRLARAWAGQLCTVREARSRRDQRWAIRTVQQRAASEHASQTHDEWLRSAEAQYQMEADR